MDFFRISKEDIIKQIKKRESFQGGNEELLFWASINGYNDIIKYLIEANREEPSKFPLQINKYWNLALRYAAKHGHVETIKILIDADADNPSYDDVIINEDNIKINYTVASAPGSTRHKERYNYLLLDWIYDNCLPSIFEMLKNHFEKKNNSFHYFERPVNPESGLYISRWHIIKFKVSDLRPKPYTVTFSRSFINKKDFKVHIKCDCDIGKKNIKCKHIKDIISSRTANIIAGKLDEGEEIKNTEIQDESRNPKEKIIENLNTVLSWLQSTHKENEPEGINQGKLFEYVNDN
ncbi:MAG: ankyrin repeat domain-containing protein [Spirochaetes bacterium]|nr:ankyrin repeat domain-containing protein [Spirochaetota bacterium]